MRVQHPSEILEESFKEFCQRRSQYSIAALARDLKVSSSYISRVFLKKKFPSKKFVDDFTRHLKLPQPKANLLKYSFIYHSLPDDDLKECLSHLMVDLNQEALIGLNQKTTQRTLHESWEPIAVMELTRLDQFQTDFQWIAKTLQITPEHASRLIKKLLKDKLLIENSDHHLQMNQGHTHFKSDSRTAAQMRTFHISCLEKAIDHLRLYQSEADQKRRLFFNVTIPTNAKRVQMGRTQLLQMAEKLNANLDLKPHEELYHLNVQFYPVGSANE